MKVKILLFVIAVFSLAACTPKQESMADLIDRAMLLSAQQAKNMAAELMGQAKQLPRSLNPQTGELVTSDSRWWCSGFFPGELWYLYEYTHDDSFKTLARAYTSRVEREKYTTTNHDVGFMLNCSFGNGLRLTHDKSYQEVLFIGSKSLITRYDSTVGLIRSWDFGKDMWQYPVIIDNMMNLELLLWAYKYSDNQIFYDISVSHADKTLQNHYRKDYSCYHVVSYDTITGKPEKKQTRQGAFDSSDWARGQVWGLYGFTMMYRETGKQKYLEQAKHIASFLIYHPSMPEDMVPYWDLLAPNIPNEKRDASTAAIMASALLELSGFVKDELKSEYIQVAEKQIRTLSSPTYLAEPGTNGNFILKHSVGSMPENSEVDVPLTYADYYYLEALIRYKKILETTEE